MNQLTALIRHHHATGAYGRAHLTMHPVDLAEMMATAAKPERPAFFDPTASLIPLTGLPLVRDEDLPPGTWRLVHNSTGEVLREGTMDEQPDDFVHDPECPAWCCS